jgi:Flp pilus assembly protein TadD
MFDIKPEEARLLLNIAMLAIGRNRFSSAAKILAALERFRPYDPSLAAVNAMLLISMGDFQGAVDYLDSNALVHNPNAAMLKTFKGMALLRMERNAEARIPLEEAANQSADIAAAQMAKDLLV